MATALHDGGGLPAAHCNTKWTIGNEQWFQTATHSQDLGLARQSGETGCTLRTTRQNSQLPTPSRPGYKLYSVPAGGKQA